jgi:hypothetical protein
MKEIFWVSYAFLWAVVAIQSLAFLELLRQMASLRRRVGPDQGASLLPGAIKAGTSLPELVGSSFTSGDPAQWDDYLHHDIGIVALLSTRCGKCREVAEDLGRLWRAVHDRVDVVAVIEGRHEELLPFVQDANLPYGIAVLDPAGTTASRLGITVNPAALTIRKGRAGVAGIVNDGYQLEALLEKESSEPSIGGDRSTSDTPELVAT